MNISMLPRLEKRYEKENEHKLNLRIKQIEDNFMAAGEEAKSVMGQRRTKSMPNRKLKPLHFLMKEELLEKILHVIESQLIQIYYMEGTLTMKLLP